MERRGRGDAVGLEVVVIANVVFGQRGVANDE
jgi:hypothetical protein